MRVNICVNGTFRYPDYARFYAQVGALGRFYFAHRRSRDAAALGLRPDQILNVWPKHYLHTAAFRAAPSGLREPIMERLCDAWQSATLRHWAPCDSVEVVLGGLADRVIRRAARDGSRVLGHAVTSHPAAFRALVAAARADLGLRPDRRRLDNERRQQAEIDGCDAILVGTVAQVRGFAANGVPADKLVMVRPGFDPARFRPRSPDDVSRDRFLVVCVGLLTPRKGQHVLLRAWRRLALPNAELLLVGTPGRDARAVLADRPPNVTCLGHVEHAAMGKILRRASCFVLPSVEDGFGQAALEAMACGVPVILSNAVGSAELVRHGQSGFVVPALDVEALAAALERLYRDRDLVVAMGRAVAQDTTTLAGWPAYVTQVLAVHRRLVARLPVAEAA